MTKEFINNMWVCVKESGEKGKFRREKDADLFLEGEVKKETPIIVEDDDQPVEELDADRTISVRFP